MEWAQKQNGTLNYGLRYPSYQDRGAAASQDKWKRDGSVASGVRRRSVVLMAGTCSDWKKSVHC